jgi:dolichyldiphosphatase
MRALKPIGLTFVEYEEGNLFAMLLAYSSLAPIFLVVAFATVMVSRRELHAFSFFTGQMLCEVITLILKKYIQHPRPEGNHLH